MNRTKPVRLAGKRPVASITFDDFPKSAWEEGGKLLAAYGVRGTYYTAGGFCGRTVDETVFFDSGDLKALAAAGHEIGCHSYGHRPAPVLSGDMLSDDIARNAAFLSGFLDGAWPESYAFPHGAASLQAKRFLGRRYTNMRGVHPGLNKGVVDLSQLNAMPVELRNWNPEFVASSIGHALRQNAWIVFYTHDVSDRPSRYGAKPGMLRQVLDLLAEAQIPILPMREALPLALGI